MNVLVTGAAGFIGSHIFETLGKRGYNVIGIDDLSGGEESNINEASRAITESGADPLMVFANGSCGHREAMLSLMGKHEVDTLVHCAANARENAAYWQPYSVTHNNVDAYSAVLSAALQLGVKRVILFSSIAVYGTGGGQMLPFRESYKKFPCDVYGLNKAMMENMTQMLCEMHGVSYCILRPHNCFDPDTEILTKDRGWVRFEDVTFQDKVATLNQKNDVLEWNTPDDIQRIQHDGDMLHFTGEAYDLLVTPDHHLWLSTDSRGKAFNFTRAEDITNKHYARRMKSASDWVGEDIPYKDLPAMPDALGRPDPRNKKRRIRINDWLKLFAWFTTEGSVFSTPSNYTISITKYDKSTRRKICALIKRCGYSPYETLDEKEIKIHSKQLYTEFIQFAGARNKRIPTELKNLPVRRLRILFKTLMMGDGNRGGAYKRYSTVSRVLADDVQEIAIKLGYRARIKEEETKLNKKVYKVFRVYFSTKKTKPQIGDNRAKKVNVERIKYSGMVYDVTVKNHVILVRRNGKAVWSGNCFGPRQSFVDPYRNAVAIFMNRIMHGEPIEIYGDGEQVRAFSYIADALPAIIHAIEYCDDVNKQTFNVGGLEAVTVNELAREVIFAMLGKENSHPIEYLPERQEVRYAYSDHTLSEKILGYNEQMGWRNGVLEMAQWALKRGPQVVQNREPLEFITDKTPQNWVDFAQKTNTLPKLPNFDDPQLLLPNE